METSAQLNADFFVDDALTGLSPAGEAEDHGQETPPADHQGLSSLPPVPSKLPRPLAQLPTGSTNQWDPRFLLDLAVGVDALPEILDRYGLDELEFDTLSRSPIFRKELAQTIRDVRENGVSFTQKARIQAESYLEVIDQLVYDYNTPASTRLESIRSMVKWGKLEAVAGEKDGVNATQININISF